MAKTRKIIQAFLASPGDLHEERQAIRLVVDEFNESWANELGYQVELIGWEETIAGFGRPQHLINQDLDRCDLFLGMIWKRWGTPPDIDGEFSSGFEEEFERSIARCEKTNSPDISLFFKQIPDEFTVDPGDDLKKVLKFRKTIIDGKKILFQDFSTVRDVEKLARKAVTAYVNRVRAEEKSSEPDELQAKRAQLGSDEASERDIERKSSPLSAEGFGFIEDLVERIRLPNSLDTLNASDVARFRLLASSISKPGNEKMTLGSHDINILFAASIEGMELGGRERRCLARLGFQHLTSENVPFWCWYSSLAESDFNPAIASSYVRDNGPEKVAAISVLTALAFELPTDNDIINRNEIIEDWFSDNSSSGVKTAALGYIAKCGTAGDLEIAQKEYARGDYGTSRSALECMVEILLRTEQVTRAEKLVLESQFETLNAKLLRTVLEGFDDLETPDLLLGLEHRNSQVRLCAMKSLHAQCALDIGLAERLSGDNDALVRRQAITVLMKLGKMLTEEEIKEILIQPQKQTMSALSGAADSDKAGEVLFKQYQLDRLKSLPEAELEKRVGTCLIYDDAPYFALMERCFKNRADELRRDVDDRFSMYFEERIRRIEAAFGNNDASHKLAKDSKSLEEYLRKELTRRGLSVLCMAQNLQDLQRIRTNLRDGYAGVSILDAKYLTKHGKWTDIPLLTNAEGPSIGSTRLTMSLDKEFHYEVARAITSIGKKHSISDLLSLEMPPAILKETIDICAESRFVNISRDALLALFNHESDGVRKSAAVMAVRAFPVKRIRAILHEYVGNGNYRYYNVIHWLDLGASMSRDDAKKVARASAS